MSQIINIYSKKNLEIVAQPVATSIDDFKKNPELFYPEYSPENHIISEITYQNPTVKNGKLQEMTKDELYKAGKYALADNEIVENGKIKTVELCECEYIENNEVKLDREKKIEMIKKDLYHLRLEKDMSPFEFTVNGETYLQNNRSIDQSNLTRIVVMLQATKKAVFDNWKFYTKDNSEKYVHLSLPDMMRMADIMQKQTTQSMVAETMLSHSLDTLTDEQLKNFNSATEYDKKYKEISE